VLEGHSKEIQTIDIDRSASRMITGGLDFLLKIWDLAGMNRKLRHQKEFKPFDGHPVRSLSFSPSGERFLCCSESN
jgi:WD40 repeat protein